MGADTAIAEGLGRAEQHIPMGKLLIGEELLVVVLNRARLQLARATGTVARAAAIGQLHTGIETGVIDRLFGRNGDRNIEALALVDELNGEGRHS